MWRWIGRFLGGAATLGWMSAVVLGALGDDPYSESSGVTAESLGLVALVAVNASAYLLSWFRERLGAALLVLGGLLFCLFALLSAGRAHLFAMSVSGLPFLASGFLLSAAARFEEPTKQRLKKG